MRFSAFAAFGLMVVALTGCQCGGAPMCAFDPSVDNPSVVYGVSHRGLLITVSPPKTPCGDQPLSVNVSVVDPNNHPFAAVTTSMTKFNGGRPREIVAFTPDQPGIWQLIALFEPSRGRVQVPIVVADERLDTPRATVKLLAPPASCRSQPFMTLDRLVLCELDGGVYGARIDGGETSFDGEQLVVLGNTVWSSSGSTLTLRFDTGSQLRVIGSASTQTLPMGDRGFSDEHFAIRMFEGPDAGVGGTVVRYELTDAGLTGTPLKARVDDLVVPTDGGLYRMTFGPVSGTASACPLDAVNGPGCSTVSGAPRAYDSSGLWVDPARSAGTLEWVQVRFGENATKPLTIPEGWDALPPATPFMPRGRSGDVIEMIWGLRPLVDREAVVLRQAVDGLALLVHHEGTETVLSYYGEGQVLGTRGRWLVLGSGDRAVTFVEY